MIELIYCRHCGHEWLPRENKLPKSCPKCKRYDWQGRITTRKPIKLTEKDVIQIFKQAEEHFLILMSLW